MEYRGLIAPLEATKGGGFATEGGSEQTKKIIMLALDWCPSENPFNTDVGIEHPVFEINDEPSIQGRIGIRIRDVLKRLESEARARLIDIKFTSEGEEFAVDIEYYDMRTDRPESVRKTYGSGGA
jgi:hypothetical protein